MSYERPLYSPLVYIELFLVIICICVTNHVLFFAPRTIFCKKCLHKQFFLKTAALWDIIINSVRKTTIVSLSVCRAFFSYNRVFAWQVTFFFGPTGWISFKKSWHKKVFLKMAERWGINVYVVAIKDHYSPLECMSSFFFSYNLYLRDKSRSFFCPQDDIL